MVKISQKFTQKRNMLEQIFNDLQTIKEQLQITNEEISVLRQSHGPKPKGWVNKKELMNLTGLKSATIDSYVSRGMITKKPKGRFYYYPSYLQHCEVFKPYKKRRPLCQVQPTGY